MRFSFPRIIFTIVKPYLIPSLTFVLILFLGCQKEYDEHREPEPGPPIENPIEFPTKTVVAGFDGRITGENDQSLVGVKISAGNKSTVTDNYGIFHLTDVVVNEQFAGVKAEKAGYFTGFRTLVAQKGKTAFVTIKLTKREYAGLASTTSPVAIQGATVVFKSPGFITEDSTSYTGQVKVFGFYHDPEAVDFLQAMPGDLRAIRTNSDIVALKSYGMLNVELEGEGGEKILLAKDNKATLTIPVPPTLQATAPSTIPLWYFDDGKRTWIEEGSATRSGNNFVGEVSHFTPWNCDMVREFVYVSLRLLRTGKSEEPLPYRGVRFFNEDGVSMVHFTNKDGELRGWVPKDVPLSYQVTDDCGEVLFTKEIGTLSDDYDLGDVFVEIPEMESLLISGSIVDCEGDTITQGFAYINMLGLDYTLTVVDGTFETRISTCREFPGTIEAFGFDNTSQRFTGRIQVPVTGSRADVKLISCGKTDSQYIKLIFRGEDFRFDFPPDSLSYNRTEITTELNAWADDLSKRFIIKLRDTVVHRSRIGMGIFVLGDSLFSAYDMNINVTKYGRIGEYIEADFNGGVTGAHPDPEYPLSGSLKILRQY
ncbi:MAG: hypothetical protein JNK79_10305 [Chitinophagaceae bacterium]|nr:hypothetical protein [Chitinophagaceae bacterium]